MAQAGDTDEEAVDDKMEVENAIRKAMNVWMKDNPDDEDEDEEGGSFLTESKFPNGAPKRGRKPKPVPNPKLKYNYLTGELLCNLCNKTMGSKEALRHHLNVAHTGGNPLYCILCTKRFRFHSTFKQHMLMEHDIDESEDQTWERVVEGKGRKMNRGILEHDIEAPIEREEAQLLYEKPANSNPYRSVRQTGLGHLSNANEILRQVRKKEEDNRRSIKIMKLKRQAPDLEVDVVIEPQETITNPMTIIQGASPVKQQRFSPPSEGAFNNAIQDEYTFTFQCNLCTKSFVSKPELEDHLNDAHTSIFGNNFSCAICSRRFHIKSNYDIHMRLDHGLDSSGRSLQQPPILERQDVDASKPANASASTTFATPGSSAEVILTDSLHDAQLDGPIGESGQEITSEIAVEVPSEPIPVQQPSNLKTRPGGTPTETAAHTSPTKTKASGTKQSAPQVSESSIDSSIAVWPHEEGELQFHFYD